MQRSIRQLSEDEIRKYFPKPDSLWSELSSIAIHSAAAGIIIALPFTLFGSLLANYGSASIQSWVPIDGMDWLPWIGFPASVLVFLMWSYNEVKFYLVRKSRKPCASVIEERHRVIDLIMLRELDHGTPAYFFLTDQGKVFFEIFGGPIYKAGWEANPTKVRSADMLREDYLRVLRPDDGSLIDSEFSGKPLARKACFQTAHTWNRISNEPNIGWADIPDSYGLQPIRLT